MNKLFKYFSIILIGLFVCVNYENVSAGFSWGTKTTKCGELVTESNGRVSQTCTFGFEITGSELKANQISANFTLTNLEIADIKPVYGWFIESGSGNSYKLQSNLLSFNIGVHDLLTVKFYKTNALENCDAQISLLYENIKRECTIYQGVYYGKSGNVVDALTYDKECNNHSCEKLADGTYFGKDGNIVDEATYNTECSKVCVIENDNSAIGETYYCKNGIQCDLYSYEKECKQHQCEIVFDEYYGKDGVVVDELTYQKECFKNTCSILSDGTIYGKDGLVVDELTYQKECGNNVCVILSDGTIFGKDGKEVDQATFDRDCKEKYYCAVVDNNYYDKEGNIVNKEEYERQCEDKHICEQINGIYYGKDGSVINENEYKAQCGNRYCEIIDNTYYDKNGNVTTKEQYDKECSNVVENPKTGAVISVSLITILGITGVGIYYFAKKRDRFI